jgi:type IV secretory pathway VirB6-like protein
MMTEPSGLGTWVGTLIAVSLVNWLVSCFNSLLSALYSRQITYSMNGTVDGQCIGSGSAFNSSLLVYCIALEVCQVGQVGQVVPQD